MGSSGLPFPTSNNAPLPIPGGGTNPAGMNFGVSSGQPFPSFPVAGPAYQTGPFSATNLGGLSSGLGFQWGKGYGSDVYNMLGKAYGKGTGQLLGNILSGGLFNPQVAAAFLNAQQPGIARGEAGIEGAFGDAGARFSSAAALGLGDFESQVQLNQQQTLAGMFEQAQGQELSLLQNLLPTIHQERADQGSWLNDVLGGIEAVGGLALAPMTGGLSLGMTTQGLGAIMGGGKAQGGGASPMMIPGMTGLPGFGGNTGTFGSNAPSWNWSSMMPSWLGGTAGQQSTWDWLGEQSALQQSGADVLADIPGLTGQ